MDTDPNGYHAASQARRIEGLKAEVRMWRERAESAEAEGRRLAIELSDAHAHAVHTIPVPRGWSAEQAWEAISRGVALTDPDPIWTNVVVRHGRLVEHDR